nr:hypothetical protein BaRGS_024484 [Batillaria attramentaria]
MDKKMDTMQAAMQEQMNKMQGELSEVVKENRELKDKVDKLEEKLDDVEGRSRRNNLIFHNIPHPQGRTETWADCEKAVKKVVKEEMGIEDDVEIERAHRLKGGRQTPHPIIVCFSKFKDKERILAERRSLRDNESDVFISEDFTPRVREKRKKLLPFLQEAKDANKRAFLRFDTLVIEGKSYIFDAATNGLVERRGRR